MDKRKASDIIKQRNNALVNGALISIGSLAVMDNIISHWIFKWHRILPDRVLSGFIEVAIFILGIVMLAIGIYREVKVRKHMV